MAKVKFEGGKKLQEHLEYLADNLDSAKQVRVGFLEDATYSDGTQVAYVAAIQNYGDPANGIPPRPFFSNMVKQNSSEWGGKLAEQLKRTHFDTVQSLGLMGEGISGELTDSIDQTNTPKLAESTIKEKGFSKPLVDTGHMKQSVGYEVDE